MGLGMEWGGAERSGAGLGPWRGGESPAAGPGRAGSAPAVPSTSHTERAPLIPRPLYCPVPRSLNETLPVTCAVFPSPPCSSAGAE